MKNTEENNLYLDNNIFSVKRFFENNVIGTAFFSVPDLVLLKANQMYLDNLEEPYNKKENSIGRKHHEILSGYKKSDYEQFFNDAISKSEMIHMQEVPFFHQRKGMTYWDLTIIPVEVNGNVNYLIVTITDVTQNVMNRQLIEKQSKKINEQLIVDKLDIPIIRLSYPDFKVVEINKKSMYLINKISDIDNIKPELIHGKSIEHLIPQFNTDENYRCIYEMAHDKKSIQLNDLKISVNDEDIHINLIYQPVIGVDGEINEILIIMNDITSEVIKRQKVEELMRMQEEFFSFITHEFRTPLTTISSAIQIMDHIYNNEITPNIRKNINMIRRNTYQQLRLVNSLLDITRAEAGYLKVHRKNLNIVDMTRLIIGSVNSFAETKGVHIVFSSTLNEKTIAVDDEKYERILLNLLSNAIRFTPRGKGIFVKVSSYGEKVCIVVKDEGTGIPRNKQNIIFERFGQVGSALTRQSEGTGIGLYLVKLLVKALDGDIIVESEEGKGTSFTIILSDVVLSEEEEVILPELTDNRLVRTANLEFANIYLE